MSPNPVLMGASCGDNPSGNSSRALFNRSETSWRARKPSTPSANVMVTCESPNFDNDRNSTMPGSPAIAASIGNVTIRSISSGASAGTSVFTRT